MNDFLFCYNDLKDVLNLLENNPKKICVILNNDKTVAGTITDGDLRRHFLKNGNLSISLSKVMNNNPIIASYDTNISVILRLMQDNKIKAIPLIDKKKKFKKVISIEEISYIKKETVENHFGFAVIMAGGEGKRLRPLTDNIPKPMVPINGVPILQHQIEQMIKNNIKDFIISLNYLGNIIEETLGNGSRLGVNIEYLREKEALDTAGSLSLITKKQKSLS